MFLKTVMNEFASGTKVAFGHAGAYSLYPLVAKASLIFVPIAAPETRDKTLEEM